MSVRQTKNSSNLVLTVQDGVSASQVFVANASQGQPVLTEQSAGEELVLVLSVIVVQRGAVLLQRCALKAVVLPVVILVVILIITSTSCCGAGPLMYGVSVLVHLVFITRNLFCSHRRKMSFQTNNLKGSYHEKQTF